MQDEPDVQVLTGLFFILVFFAATQGASSPRAPLTTKLTKDRSYRYCRRWSVGIFFPDTNFLDARNADGLPRFQAGHSRSSQKKTSHTLQPRKPSASTPDTFSPSPCSSLSTRSSSGTGFCRFFPLCSASEKLSRPFPSDSNKYFRSTPLDYPLVSLSGYLHFWAVAFIAVTAYLAFFQPEVSPRPNRPLYKMRST